MVMARMRVMPGILSMPRTVILSPVRVIWEIVTRQPPPTKTKVPTYTLTASVTATLVPPTATSTFTPLPTDTPTNTLEPTSTEVTATLEVPTGTPIVIATDTVEPTATVELPTGTPIVIATETVKPTDEPTKVPTATVILTQPATATLAPTLTMTLQPTQTDPGGHSCAELWNLSKGNTNNGEWSQQFAAKCGWYATKTPRPFQTGSGSVPTSTGSLALLLLGVAMTFVGLGGTVSSVWKKS